MEILMAKAAKKAKPQRRKPQKATAKKKTSAKTAAIDQDIATRMALRKRGANRVNEESKALFLDHHLPKIARLKELANTAQANLRNGYKTAKKDGFLKRDFDIAFRLKSQTGEKAIKAEIARDMTIAKWLGYGLGKQLDLFLEADDHDIEAQAYADGEEASRTNKPAAPIYAPETPGYEAYMRGFHDHQETLVKGIKKLEPESGVAMTRSQFRAQQAAAKKLADAAEERSLFTKRSPEAAAE
jgi:hypothetical protein